MNQNRRGVSLNEMMIVIAVGSVAASMFSTWFVRLHLVNRQLEEESLQRRTLEQLAHRLVGDCRESDELTLTSTGTIVLQGFQTVEYTQSGNLVQRLMYDEHGNPKERDAYRLPPTYRLTASQHPMTSSLIWQLEAMEPTKPWRQAALWQVRARLSAESYTKESKP